MQPPDITQRYDINGRDGSVQKQSRLYQTMTPIFCYSHLKTVNLAVVKIAVLQDCNHNI